MLYGLSPCPSGRRRVAGFTILSSILLAAIALPLLLAQPPAAPKPRLGIWKLAGAATFPLKELPPTGPASHSYSTGFTTVYEVSDGKVHFTSTMPRSPKVLVVGETQWGRPPEVIVPGEIIPIRGTAALLEHRDGGLGFGSSAGLMAHFGTTLILGVEKGATMKASSHPYGGIPARRQVEYRNTTESWGVARTPFSASYKELNLVFTTTGAGHSPKVSYRYVWSPGAEIPAAR